MNNPKENFIYNIIYQILILIIPLVTAPYLSRVIGSSGLGTYSYTYSIVYYFMMLTMLGVNNYGNRTIAKVRDNKEELSKTFLSIYILQLIMGFIMIAIYIPYVLLFDDKYKMISLTQSIFIISAMLDINWFFFGLEEFKKTITRNIFLKIGTVILIFLLVKSKADTWKYTLIMSTMTCLSQLILWGYTRGKIKYTKVKKEDVIKHIKPNLSLFITVIAVGLYKTMDKIMLGSLITVSEVGFYENAEKIINIPVAIITALGTVMLPRISNLLSKIEIKKVKYYISKSIEFVMFMSLPMCFGLAVIGRNFAPLYFGLEFKKTGILITLLSITLPFISFANVLRTQYLIPKEKDKIFIISVLLGAITNLIMNFILIPILSGIGACIGTIAAEFIVMLYQIINVRKDLPILRYIKNSIPFLIKSILMFILIYPLNYIQINSVLRIFIQIFTGCLVYVCLNVKYIFSIINLKK